MALEKCMTIKEMFIFAALKSYQIEVDQGDQVGLTSYTKESDLLFKEYIGDEIDMRKQDIN